MAGSQSDQPLGSSVASSVTRVLFVSTDDATAVQAQAALPDEMYGLTVAAPGVEALEQVFDAEGGCDLVLLDRRLVDGEEGLLERFLDRARGHDIPLIVLGPDSGTSVWAPLLHAGASAYINLPLDTDGLAAQAAALLRTKDRLDQLRDQAVIDQLTRIYNRRYLDEQLGARLGEAQRYTTPFSIGLLDIDHFKVVNDSHGHQVGDIVLAETAALVRRQMRKEDLVARYGGEEFAVMLPHTDRLGAAILAERVREAVAEHAYECGDGLSVSITVSLGVASFPLDEVKDAAELLRLADTRLYQAKSGGRNQTVFD